MHRTSKRPSQTSRKHCKHNPTTLRYVHISALACSIGQHRLKTAQLGYTLPQTFTRRFGVESLRIFVEGNNLFTLDGLPEGIDPESPGVNNGYYPQQRNILGGITLTL